MCISRGAPVSPMKTGYGCIQNGIIQGIILCHTLLYHTSYFTLCLALPYLTLHLTSPNLTLRLTLPYHTLRLTLPYVLS